MKYKMDLKWLERIDTREFLIEEGFIVGDVCFPFRGQASWMASSKARSSRNSASNLEPIPRGVKSGSS